MLKQTLALAGLSVLTLSANAALYDRGNGMIYDDVLNITWLQDANYAHTSGYLDNIPNPYANDGRMSWYQALEWAEQLEYGGYDDWRLPSVLNNPVFGNNDTTTELGYMFHINLGNQGHFDADCGFSENAPNYCLNNTNFVDAGSGLNLSIVNLKPEYYWFLETVHTNHEDAWAFYFDLGYLDVFIKGDPDLFAWAVRDGDVSAVPIPAAAWLFSSALIGLAGIKRKK